MLEYPSGDGCGRPIDLGSAKTVGQRGRHARISKKARTVVRVNQTRIMQGRAKKEKKLIPKEAVESAYKHQPDVILIDTGLSECSSVEVMQRIREGLSKTNIIVLTHSETDDDLIFAAKAGARAYLSKDVSIDNLIKAIILVAEVGSLYLLRWQEDYWQNSTY